MRKHFLHFLKVVLTSKHREKNKSRGWWGKSCYNIRDCGFSTTLYNFKCIKVVLNVQLLDKNIDQIQLRFIHYLVNTLAWPLFFRVKRKLEPIQSHSRSHLRSVHTCCLLTGRKKPKQPEETHAGMKRTCKLYTERPQSGSIFKSRTLLL